LTVYVQVLNFLSRSVLAYITKKVGPAITRQDFITNLSYS